MQRKPMNNTLLFLMLFFMLFLYPINTTAAKPPAAKPLAGKTIAIDPGHGGYDPGAIRGDVYEKNITLTVSKILAQKLQNQGAETVLTRCGDYNHAICGLHGRSAKRYDFNQRIKIIHDHDADIVISIHVNSLRNRSYAGAETFYHPRSPNGKILADNIQTRLKNIPGMRQRTVKSSCFYILCNTKVTSVLVELGFLSNPREGKLLQQPDYQEKLADHICQGVIDYYRPPKTDKDG